jgi:hypothetical protein
MNTGNVLLQRRTRDNLVPRIVFFLAARKYQTIQVLHIDEKAYKQTKHEDVGK